MPQVFVVGGGITGLACADALAERGFHATVLEAGSAVGGMAATIDIDGHRFDMGPHKLYSPMPEPMARVRGLFADGTDLLSIPKVSQIHVHGRALGYPLSLGELLTAIPPRRVAAFGASFLAARFTRGSVNGSYASFMRQQFGHALYEDVFGPAARKVFGEDERLSRRLGEARFRGKSLATFLAQVLRGDRRRIDAVSFLYPRLGTGELPERLRARIEARGGRVRTGAEVVRLHGDGGVVRAIQLHDGTLEVAPDDAVIYTAPLRDAPRLLGLPDAAREPATHLGYRTLVLVYLLLRRPAVMGNQWMFFPTADVSFNRLSEPRNFSAAMAPPGRTSLVAEVTAPAGLPPAYDAEAAQRVIADLERLGLIARGEVDGVHTRRFDTGYPVWTVGFEESRERLLSHLDALANVYPLGRQGLYQYVGIMDCVDMALRTAHHIASREPRAAWVELRRELEGYPVVD